MRRGVLFWLGAFLLILFPVLLGWSRTPEGAVFTGHLNGGEDYPTYLAKIELGRQGAWAYRDLFTGEETRPVPVYWFYLALGHLGRLAGVPAVWLYHLARAVLGASALLLLYLTLRESEGGRAGVASLAGVFSVGWLSFFRPHTVVPQAHLFGALLTFPHYMLNLLGWLILFRGYGLRPGFRRVGFAVLGSALMSGHPFLLLPASLLPLVRAWWAGEPLRPAAWYGVVVAASGAPLLGWMGPRLLSEPWVVAWRAQAAKPLYPLALALASFGLAAYLSTWRLSRRQREDAPWAAWLLACWGCAYLFGPGNWWEYLFMVSVPFGVLGLRGLWQLSGGRRWLEAVGFGVMVLAGCLGWGAGLGKVPEQAYLSGDVVAVYGELSRRAAPGDVALVVPVGAGNLVPYLTGCRVRPYLGHSSETLEFGRKLEDAGRFLEGGPVPAGVGWVVELRGLPASLESAGRPGAPRGSVVARPGLEEVWSGPGGTVWRVCAGNGGKGE